MTLLIIGTSCETIALFKVPKKTLTSKLLPPVDLVKEVAVAMFLAFWYSWLYTIKQESETSFIATDAELKQQGWRFLESSFCSFLYYLLLIWMQRKKEERNVVQKANPINSKRGVLVKLLPLLLATHIITTLKAMIILERMAFIPDCCAVWYFQSNNI